MNKYLFSIGFTGRFVFFNYRLKKMSRTACEGESQSMLAKLRIFRFGSILSVNLFFHSFCQKNLVKILVVLGKIRDKILYEASCALLVPKRHLQRGKQETWSTGITLPTIPCVPRNSVRRGVLGRKGRVCGGFDRLCHHNL